MSLQGNLFEVQHLALYDGPGIRTVLYLKGCPLRCLWCHNPEGCAANRQLQFLADRCGGCGRCVPVCPNGAHRIVDGVHTVDRTRCTACGACAAACEAGALVPTGRTVTVEELLDEILCDRAFYGDDGGVTLSGGEPLLQADFACAVLAAAKAAGVSTCMETCGYAPEAAIRKAAEVTDLFLYDVKALDPARHKALTGVENGPIRSNLQWLNGHGARVILRCPLIPDCNLDADHLNGVAALAEQLTCVEAVELEPYHPLGLAKYRSLGLSPAYDRTAFLEPEALRPYLPAMRAVTGKPIRLSNGEPI